MTTISDPAGTAPRRNLLLRMLPDQEYQRLLPDLEPVQLATHDLLFERGKPIEHLYFPVDCVLSLIASVDGEAGIEVATIGYEGMAGLPVFLGSTESSLDMNCQVSGDAVRLSTAELHRFLEHDGALHDALHRYTQATMVQLSQSVACNRLHSTEERCARWLLQTRDRVGADDFDLTQEFLSQMLAVRRTSVSEVAAALADDGCISYRRGTITVLDRDRLEANACTCYRIIRDAVDLAFPPPGGRPIS